MPREASAAYVVCMRGKMTQIKTTISLRLHFSIAINSFVNGHIVWPNIAGHIGYDTHTHHIEKRLCVNY